MISISLKDADATDYETAKRMLCSIIGSEAMRFSFLAESDRLSDFEKEQYRQLVRIGGKGEPGFIMEDEVITDARYDEHFGFSDKEVRKLLAFYGVEDRYETVKEWYDGYRFGNADVYCPWDVINYVDLLRSDPNAIPRAFWINTSSNDILKTFLRTAKQRTKREIEQLVDGQCIIKNINQELTYRDLYQNTDNLWSVLFTTGYLTHRGRPEGEKYRLSIPNLEIRKIFVDQILSWFQENARKGNKENFYHGILLGLLSHCGEWDIDSNVESSDGFSDILVEIEEEKIGIVIKVKYSRESSLEADCRKALTQIREKNYERKLRQDGMTRIIRYGIACRKKRMSSDVRRMMNASGEGGKKG